MTAGSSSTIDVESVAISSYYCVRHQCEDGRDCHGNGNASGYWPDCTCECREGFSSKHACGTPSLSLEASLTQTASRSHHGDDEAEDDDSCRTARVAKQDDDNILAIAAAVVTGLSSLSGAFEMHMMAVLFSSSYTSVSPLGAPQQRGCASLRDRARGRYMLYVMAPMERAWGKGKNVATDDDDSVNSSAMVVGNSIIIVLLAGIQAMAVVGLRKYHKHRLGASNVDDRGMMASDHFDSPGVKVAAGTSPARDGGDITSKSVPPLYSSQGEDERDRGGRLENPKSAPESNNIRPDRSKRGWLYQKGSTSSEQSSSDTMENEANRAMWLYAAAQLYFPSCAYAAAEFLYPALAMGTFSLLSGSETHDIEFGCVGLVALVAIPAVIGLTIPNQRKYGNYKQANVPLRLRMVMPRSYIKCSDTHRAFYWLAASYVSRKHALLGFFFTMPVVAISCAVLYASPLTLGDGAMGADCGARYSALAVGYFLIGATMLIARPHRVVAESVLRGTGLCLLACLSAVMAAEHFKSTNSGLGAGCDAQPRGGSTLWGIKTILSSLVMVTVLLRCALCAFVCLYFQKARQARRFSTRRGAKESDRSSDNPTGHGAR